MDQLPPQPVELTYLLPNGKPDLSRFDGTPEHYAEYFGVFQKYCEFKDNAASRLAYTYLSLGGWGLLALGPVSLRVLPGLLAKYKHPWVRESVVGLLREFMSEADFGEKFINFVK